MKKLICLIMCLLFLVACTSSSLSDEDQQYQNLSNQLRSQQTFQDSQNLFSIRIVFEEVDDGYRYVLTIDEPLIPMYNMIVLCNGGEGDDEILPSIGIYDSEEYHLVPDKVDKTNGYYKGIQLSGFVTKKQDVDVYVHYYEDQNQTIEKEIYLKVKS